MQESVLMLRVATGLFVLAALGGVVMAAIHFFGKRNPPPWLAMGHGLMAGAGLTLLLYAAFAVGIPTLATWALVLFIAAALGGLVMNLNYQWKQRPLPSGLLMGHAAVAVVAFLMLLAAAFS